MLPDKKINVLIHGVGCVSSSLFRNFKKSAHIGHIYIYKPNRKKFFNLFNFFKNKKNFKLKDYKQILKKNHIDFVISFSDYKKIEEFINFYKGQLNIPVITTPPEYYKIESDKVYGKTFMLEHNIKIPKYKVLGKKDDLNNIDEFGFPIVIKSNNLQAGYGSYIFDNKKDAIKKAKEIIKTEDIIIVEEYISGIEFTQQYLWDGNTLVDLLPVKDYKPLCDGNKGINTGGMGSYTPFDLTENQKELLKKYNEHMSEIFQKLKPDLKSIFAANLIISNNEIYTFEINMRPGITEFENVIEHMDCDILELFYNLAYGQLSKTDIKYKEGYTGCVVVSEKSIGKKLLFCRNKKINIKEIYPTEVPKDIKINYSFFYDNKNAIIRPGGRIYNILTTSETKSFNKIYDFINKIKYKNIYYRKDIGTDYKH